MDDPAANSNTALVKLSKRQRRRQAREQRKQAATSNSSAPSKQHSRASRSQMSRVAGEPPQPQIITEGTATIQLPAHVFYNRCQVFNRDLTIAVINQLLRSRVFSSAGRKLPPFPLSCPPGGESSASVETNQKSVRENPVATPVSQTPDANKQQLPEESDLLYGKVRILEALAASGLRY